MALNVIDRTLKAVLVDDEELARGYLRELLAPHPEIQVVAECANGFEAVKAIAETSPDLLFLDVQMPKLDGFEVLELIEPAQAPVVVKDGTHMHVIPIARLDYVAAQDDYVALHSEGKSYLKQQPIAALEALLDPACFVRIHRSAIVNLERVARIEPYGKESRIAILNDGTRLPVSRPGYARLLEAMGDSQGNRNSTR